MPELNQRNQSVNIERVGIDEEKSSAVDDTLICASSHHLEYLSRLIMSLPMKYTFLEGYAVRRETARLN